jgi:demethylmenaquinone methyltransferase/2-methoxy-6-polyprenyl-1,4-benzoquinol methylase
MTGDSSTLRTALPAPAEKPTYVQAMFDAIAPRYDLLNSLLSLRLHHRWRRVAARQATLKPGDHALDVCTGTGDLARELARAVGRQGQVIGTDFAANMLRLGQRKFGQSVRFVLADTQALPFPSDSFDAVTVAFGIRNVADLETGIREMARVARPGGRVLILEFNQPTNPLVAALYRFYSFRIMPRLGGLISGRRSAYTYLPASVAAFASRETISQLMERTDLADITVTELNLGTVVLHRGVKNAGRVA